MRIKAEDMSGPLAPKAPTPGLTLRQHIAIAHAGAGKGDGGRLKRLLQPEVRHQGTHDSAGQRALAQLMLSQHIKQTVSIPYRARAIHHDQPVTVAIEGKPKVRARFEHPGPQGCAP